MELKNALVQSSILEPSPKVKEYNRRSMIGQLYMIRNTQLQRLRLFLQMLYSVGIRQAQVKQRKAISNKGIRRLARVRPFSLEFTKPTIAENKINAAKNMTSLQKLKAKIVRRMSSVTKTASKVIVVPIRSPFPYSRLITSQLNTTNESFHKSQEQIRLIATATGELGPLVLEANSKVESVTVGLLSVYEDIVELTVQQCED